MINTKKAKPNNDLSAWLSKERIMNTSHGSQVGGGNMSHSGNINISLSGSIQLQDPNGNVHNWDNLSNNPQFVSHLTDKISLEITKKMSYQLYFQSFQYSYKYFNYFTR